MSGHVFICDSRAALAAEHGELAWLLGSMGLKVSKGGDLCSPSGQRRIAAELGGDSSMVLICPRALPRQVFQAILASGQRYYSFASGGEPRAVADHVYTEVTLSPQRAVLPAPPVRKALVIGGGVGGVYAALDIAEQGYQAFLVERDPSIGGVMAALDKTFPTMDCSI
ncbi:MAG: FAD-dependent oxidoreductase [Candidatus Geothermincolia bacterium]